MVTATSFNPTIFGQLWLVSNDVVAAGEFLPGSIFTDQIVQVNSKDFSLMVMAQQLALTPSMPATGSELVERKMTKIVDLIPHTPFTAVGMNFLWRTDPLPEPAETFRRLFCGTGSAYAGFSAADARFGAYLSKDVTGGCRLRVDIRPVADPAPPETPRVERINFGFNFQRELLHVEKRAEAVASTMSRWDEFRLMAERIVNETLAGVGGGK